MSECKSCSTPLEPKCTQADFTNSELFKGPFRELIGPLLYQAVTTRRDILFTVNCFSQLQEKPTAAAWTQKDLKRLCVMFLATAVIYKEPARTKAGPGAKLTCGALKKYRPTK
ncbi:hypothetical protein AVEN_258703-1 [Araneus ventricosus]|uniref:Uncharacterized protein n=1 Tax=Araneus ventricosus TaxID=182803 RepID=A0A4Y2RVC9_ARAVE|nr:hypothetical protein AVEN_258703-1 [Araneus ventricosus]